MSLKIHADGVLKQTIDDLINFRLRLGSLGLLPNQEEMKKLDAIWHEFRKRFTDQPDYQRELLANCTQLEAPGKAIAALLATTTSDSQSRMQELAILYNQRRHKFESEQSEPVTQIVASAAPAITVAAPVAPANRYLAAGIDSAAAEFLKRIDEAELAIHKIQADVGRKSLASIDAAYKKAVPIAEIAKVFDEIVAVFSKEYEDKLRSNYYSRDLSLLHFRPGMELHSEGLNKTHSVEYAMYHSLSGLFNLLIYGGEIMDELRGRLFIAGERFYESREGLNKMKALTGYTVNLCDTVSGNSEIDQSLVDNFQNLFADLRGDIARLQIRNVPYLPDVFGTILLAPLRLAQTYLVIKSSYTNQEFRDKLNEFFNSCLTRSCNQWHDILNYSKEILNRIDMTAQCGSKAAFEKMEKEALSEGVIQENLMFAETILPPENAARAKALDEASFKKIRAEHLSEMQWRELLNSTALTVDQWKILAKDRYIDKARMMGVWGKLFINRESGQMTYSYVDEKLIVKLMSRFVQAESAMGTDRWRA